MRLPEVAGYGSSSSTIVIRSLEDSCVMDVDSEVAIGRLAGILVARRVKLAE